MNSRPLNAEKSPEHVKNPTPCPSSVSAALNDMKMFTVTSGSATYVPARFHPRVFEMDVEPNRIDCVVFTNVQWPFRVVPFT